MMVWANPKPWMCAWVIAELGSPGFHRDVCTPQASIRASSPHAHAIGDSTPLHMVRGGTISPTEVSCKWGVVLAGLSKVVSALLHPCHWG